MIILECACIHAMEIAEVILKSKVNFDGIVKGSQGGVGSVIHGSRLGLMVTGVAISLSR